ncbi:MAG: YybH family protein [Novipirellula sp. JB048]
MPHFLSLVSFVCVVSVGGMAVADDPAAGAPSGNDSHAETESDQDLAAIRAQSVAFVEAFNQHDAKAVAAFWTEDGEFIDDAGVKFSGRDEIEKSYAEAFAHNPGVTLRIAIDSLRLLSEHAAMERGRAVVEPAPTDSLGYSRYEVVQVKVDGQWLMASVRDTWVEPEVSQEDTADLGWLIGKWTAEEHGNRMESEFRWVANNSFVERSYTTTQLDGTTVSGVQLIGWNPSAGCVQSWDFSAGGGHAVGVWSPTKTGWTSQMTGVTGDGVPTSAVNQLRRLDDNAYVWQSIDRTVGGMPLADSDEVVIKRSPDGE